MVIKVVKVGIINIAVNILYVGFLINIEKIEGDMHLNLLLLFTGEMTADFAAGILLQKYSPKDILVAMFSFSFLFCNKIPAAKSAVDRKSVV